MLPLLPSRTTIEAWFHANLDKLTVLLIQHTPYCHPSPREKPWWSPLLATLLKGYHSATRAASKSGSESDRTAARLSKVGYFKAIKKAKSVHGSSLFSSATPQNIWTTKRRALGKSPSYCPDPLGASTPDKINNALLSHAFLQTSSLRLPITLSAHTNCPPILSSEVAAVLAKCSASSAPGPYSIPYSVWKIVHVNAPCLLPSLRSPLLRFAHHPDSQKKANGIVLDKPGKCFYNSP